MSVLVLLTGFAGVPATADPVPAGVTAADSAADAVPGLVDAARRRPVTSIYQSEWNTPVPDQNWTGSTSTCTAGTVAQAFRNRHFARINAFRRLAGTPADVVENADYSAKAQYAALIMSANWSLSHDPPPSWRCWTQVGHDAAGSSNLATTGGVDAIDLYMTDPGAGNEPAGHRWYVLSPWIGQMGVGSVSGANALWVSDFGAGERPVREADGGILWPPRGFSPYQLTPIRWSYSAPGADYSAAAVTMVVDGRTVPVTVEDRGDFGQLVWRRSDMDPNAWFASWPRPAADQVIDVTVTGVVVDGVSRTVRYSTVVYDPDDTAARFRGDLAAHTAVPIKVAGVGGVPADATAVVVNATVTNPAGSGYLTLWPCDQPRPLASTLNYRPGQTIPNLAVVPVAADGTICAFPQTSMDLVLDVGGHAGPAATSRFTGVTPARLLDTRQTGGALARGEVRQLTVSGVPGLSQGSVGAVLNVTATGATESGFVTLYPCDRPRPATSNLNTVAGRAVANLASVRLDGSGRVCLYASRGTHLVVDLQGGLHPATGAGLLPVTPSRLLDTRTTTRLAAGEERRVQIAGRGGLPADVTAVVANLTVTGPAASGYVTAYPCGHRPPVSNVNFAAGDTIANAATVTLDAQGALCVYTMSATDLVVDVSGGYRGTGGSPQSAVDPFRVTDSREN
jgi:hypothetical protein